MSVDLKHTSSKNRVKFLGSALGIFVCYFYYGILQEDITKRKYVMDEEEGTTEKFVYTWSLVGAQCVVNYFYAQLLSKTVMKPKPTDAHIEAKLYGICSFTYLLAMISSNLALQWVPYPTQVIGKSCKPIPVMILGVLLGGRSYSLRKYLFVLLIVLGVALFMYKPKNNPSAAASSGGLTGEMLLIMSLSMDGLTGAVQERMRHGSQRPNSATMMKMMNLFSVMYTSVFLIFSGEIFTFAQFCTRHPIVLWKIFSFSIASALGQFFIYVVVSDFGPLPCSIITTTRKFFTVMASVLLFGNVLSGLQWLGAAFVFVGLGLDSVYK